MPTEAELARQEGRDYEPASVLLERARVARAAAADDSKRSTRSRMCHPSMRTLQRKLLTRFHRGVAHASSRS